MDLTLKIKEKKEFKNLPDDIITFVLNEFKNLKDESEIIKKSREKLRKYFGVFLTNKIVKPKNILDFDFILNSHISSSKRNYNLFYSELFNFNFKNFDCILDFGCGVNGFSYPYIQKKLGNVEYIGFDASFDVVKNTNLFFEKKKINNCQCFHKSLFNLNDLNYFFKQDKNLCIFCFQVLDALDKIKTNFSLNFLKHLKLLMKTDDVIILSSPLESISGKTHFKIKRKKLLDFINLEFIILKEFNLYREHFLILKPKLLKT